MTAADDVGFLLEQLSSDDAQTRVITLEALAENPTGSPDVLARARDLLTDDTPTILSVPFVYGEVRYMAARALVAEHHAAGIAEPVVLADVPTPLAIDELATLRDGAGMRWMDPLAAYAELRERREIPLRTIRLDPAAWQPPAPTRTPDGAGKPADSAEDPVELIGRALDFADQARTTMGAEFGVQYVSEVAMLARLNRIPRRGTCGGGLPYDIHGNGYDVYAAETAPLTVQGHGYAAAADRPAGPDDGLYDYVDLYALRDFLVTWAAIEVDLDTLAEACAEHCRRGVLRDAGDLRYELVRMLDSPPVPAGVEEDK